MKRDELMLTTVKDITKRIVDIYEPDLIIMYGSLWESYFLLRKGGFKVSTVKYMDEELVIKKVWRL